MASLYAGLALLYAQMRWREATQRRGYARMAVYRIDSREAFLSTPPP